MTIAGDIITYAQHELGKPYAYGDEGPNTFDCSGLMQWIFGEAGVKLPRTAAQQQKIAAPVKTPVPGDLVFYGAPAHHVALYVGNGMQIAAPHTGTVVQMQKVSTGATYGRVSGVGSAAGALFTPVVDTINTAGGKLIDWGAGRSLVVEGGAALAGVGLVIAGLWLAVGQSAMRNELNAQLQKGGIG